MDALDPKETLVGSAAAIRLGLAEGDAMALEDRSYRVAKVLPETGTVDDDRVFLHIHEVQAITGIEAQVSSIEIMGCCNAISDGLLAKLRNILPDTRITTVKQIVSTQIDTNQLMKRVSLSFLFIVLFVGAVSIGNYMWANVNERRREIGILRMIGTPKSGIYGMLLMKALVLGLVGGVLGFVLGTVAGMTIGTDLTGLTVKPVPMYFVYSVLLSVGIALLGCLVPAHLAARIEPFANMQEV